MPLIKRLLFILIIPLVFLFSGCATIYSQEKSRIIFNEGKYVDSIECSFPTPHVYSGVVTDLQVLTYPFSCMCGGGEEALAAMLAWPIFIPLSIIDLPLSASADTLILPYSIYRQYKYSNINEGCYSELRSRRDTNETRQPKDIEKSKRTRQLPGIGSAIPAKPPLRKPPLRKE